MASPAETIWYRDLNPGAHAAADQNCQRVKGVVDRFLATQWVPEADIVMSAVSLAAGPILNAVYELTDDDDEEVPALMALSAELLRQLYEMRMGPR